MGSAPKTILRALAATAVLAAAILPAPADSLKAWRDGPVSGLLTREEYHEYGELKTDAERQAFIDRFWRQIDAGAGAAQTAYREIFERRCEAANARFETGGQEGWRTDRGRVYLALGEPSAIGHVPGGAEAIDEEVWTYGSSDDSASALKIAFYRCPDGAYRLDSSCAGIVDPTSVAYDDERNSYLSRLRDSNPSIDSVRLAAMFAAFLAPTPGGVPIARRASAHPMDLKAAVPSRSPSSAPSPNVHVLDPATYFFRAQDGSVLTLMSISLLGSPASATAVLPDGAPPYLGAASIEETGPAGENLPETSAQTVVLDAEAASGRDRARFYGRVYLHAGKTYAVRYAVRDAARDEVVVKQAIFGVPDLAAGFAASSIVPAETFGPAGPEAGRFKVGSEVVVPKAGGAFSHSELLRLYLQVYDAAIDEKTSRPRVDVVFRFYRTGGGSEKRYGKPYSVRGAAGASMGLALPIGDWPAGEYRVDVDLHDRVAEQRTSTEGRFTIAAD
jgi:GWxTD domain-containing protein